MQTSLLRGGAAVSPSATPQEMRFDVHVVARRPAPQRPLYLLDAADLLAEAAEAHARALREVEQIIVVLPAGAIEDWIAAGSPGDRP